MKRFLFLSLVLFGLISAQESLKTVIEPINIQMAIKNSSFDKIFNDGELEKNILINNTRNPFHILITNTVGIEIIIWQEWCSWGFFNLTFEILDKKGKVVYVIRKNGAKKWTENYPDPRVISPGETLVRSVTFTKSTWDLPTIDDLPRNSYEHSPEVFRKTQERLSFTMRAVFEIKDTSDIPNWIGRIRSESERVTFIYPWKQVIQYENQ